MQQTRVRTIAFDTALMERDIAEKGWLKSDLARAARVSEMTLTRFFRGQHQTARTADKLARALGRSIRRYMRVAKAATV